MCKLQGLSKLRTTLFNTPALLVLLFCIYLNNWIVTYIVGSFKYIITSDHLDLPCTTRVVSIDTEISPILKSVTGIQNGSSRLALTSRTQDCRAESGHLPRK